MVKLALLLGAGAMAAVTGFLLSLLFSTWRQRRKRSEALRLGIGAGDLVGSLSVGVESVGFDRRVLSLLVERSRQAGDAQAGRLLAPWMLVVGDCDELITKAGLAGLVTKEGIASFGQTLSVGGALTGALVGIFFSEMMAVLLGVLGFALGFTQAKRSLGHEREKRSEMVERDLSQCLEVIVLGLRSGLSFDRSLAFYQEYFDGGLSRATSLAQTQWSYGLLSRTEGLRSLAASYDSDLFERTVEGIIRSLRFGTSLSSDLSEQAASARASRRAKLEERVAKAPVKMLLPVGALILPAMLMLVLGPILLELMNGF